MHFLANIWPSQEIARGDNTDGKSLSAVNESQPVWRCIPQITILLYETLIFFEDLQDVSEATEYSAWRLPWDTWHKR